MKKKICWSSILFCLVISDSKQLQKLFKSAIFIFNCKINKILRYKAHWVTKHIEVICNIIYSTLLLQILIVLCYGNMYVKTIAATFLMKGFFTSCFKMRLCVKYGFGTRSMSRNYIQYTFKQLSVWDQQQTQQQLGTKGIHFKKDRWINNNHY